MTLAKALPHDKLVSYDEDVLLWSQQQARLLRAGRFAELDLEHLADEIEFVGKSEKRELASRIAVLLAHLFKGRAQPARRSNSWRRTIRDQRRRVALCMKAAPSLRTVMSDPDWREDTWLEAASQIEKDTGLPPEDIPEASPFSFEDACDPDFWPD